jgi:hypothetical protein
MPRTTETPDPPPAPPEAEARYRRLVERATAVWRQWAEGMAAGRPGPKPLELMEVAAVLELRRPGELLDEDVHAIQHERRLHDAIIRHRAANPRIWTTPPEPTS